MRTPKLLPSPVPRKTNTALSPNKALSSSVTPLVKKKIREKKRKPPEADISRRRAAVGMAVSALLPPIAAAPPLAGSTRT